MKNKGFTLIELLAVIVILAIIALIATPIIIGMIDDARSSAKERSAELVYTGVQYAYTSSLYAGTEGASLPEVTLSSIKDNLTIDNMKEAKLDAESNPTKLTIQTDDGVYCDVTVSGKSFSVVCRAGEDASSKKLLDKNLLATK